LTVLKGSTEELIANDALQLALLIDDYLDAADSSNTGTNNNLRLFAKADLLIFQNKFDLANKTMDSIKFFTGLNTLADDILMLKANISLKKKEYLSADSIFKQIYTDYPDGILSDDALYKSAVLNEETLKNTDKAKSLYEKIILEYKGSVFGVDAANRFRKLRGDVVY
jgi:tetratricopeptide (TPR) repeat protein